MPNLKISLVHGNVTDIRCSTVFIKHIEGTLSMPEKAIDAKLDGKLSSLYEEKEQDDQIIFDSHNQLPFPYFCAIIFHKDDLPFSYSSVDEYARKIFKISIDDHALSKVPVKSVATAVHGPG